jgi:hypothetical protein
VLWIYSVDFRWMKYEHGALVKWYCQRKPNYLERNLSLSHFISHKFHMDSAGIEHEPHRWATIYAWAMAGNLFLSEKTVLLHIFFPDVYIFISLGNDAVLQNSLSSKKFCSWGLPLTARNSHKSKWRRHLISRMRERVWSARTSRKVCCLLSCDGA